MKYLKTYEDAYNNIEYWKINAEPIEDVKYALLKAGVNPNDNIIDSIIMDPNIGNRKKYFYLIKYLDENKKTCWMYSFDDDLFSYKYNSEIKVTELDKKMIDYNL